MSKRNVLASVMLVLMAAATQAGNGVERDVIDYGPSASELPDVVRASLNRVVAKGCPALAEMAMINGRAMAVVSRLSVGPQSVDQGLVDVVYDVVISIPNRSGSDSLKVVLRRLDSSSAPSEWFELLDLQAPESCRIDLKM